MVRGKTLRRCDLDQAPSAYEHGCGREFRSALFYARRRFARMACPCGCRGVVDDCDHDPRCDDPMVPILRRPFPD